MKAEEDAFALAREMVRIGKNAGRNTSAVVSDMDQPLGRAVGNALEVIEAIETLKGNGPADFVELCLTLGSRMLLAGGRAADEEQAVHMLRAVIEDGSALDKFAQFVRAQGGDDSAVYNTNLLPAASIVEPIPSPESGYVAKIACDEIGMCSLILGGGRETKESPVDPAVGLILCKKTGDAVKRGEPLGVIHANSRDKLEQAKERFLQAYVIGEAAPEPRALIRGVVTE